VLSWIAQQLVTQWSDPTYRLITPARVVRNSSRLALVKNHFVACVASNGSALLQKAYAILTLDDSPTSYKVGSFSHLRIVTVSSYLQA
jgi:hypothetical protein